MKKPDQQKKYELVQRYLLTFIDQKKFTEDVRLPSEHFLSNKLEVSRETVRKALAKLAEQHIIYPRKGSGA